MAGQQNKFVISGGGTGGHIYPAIAIADELKRRHTDAKILFVGAEGKMEMSKVPKSGYEIVGLNISGLDRKNILRNVHIIYKYLKSLSKAKKILQQFKPTIVIGVGGYASAPTLKKASKLGIPTLIQEQNSYAGVSNKMLSKKATAICVAYDHMEKYFPKDKIIKTGNPCRESLLEVRESKEEARKHFGLSPNKKTILVVGGSLGAKTINLSLYNKIEKLRKKDIQVIWQCGSSYLFDLSVELKHKLYGNASGIVLLDFIDRMDLAYKAADLVISRAGASSISELSLLHKPCILVPSPNVAGDHQSKNAMALCERNAAILVKDKDAIETLIMTSIEIIEDEHKLNELSKNIATFAEKDSAKRIVDVIDNILNTIKE